MDYKTTSNQEAKMIIARELESAGKRLTELGAVQNTENLLLFFAQNIETMLTKHLSDWREFLEGTNSREKELMYWITQVAAMITALQKYQEGLDQKNLQFLEDATKLFTEKYENLTRIVYN